MVRHETDRSESGAPFERDPSEGLHHGDVFVVVEFLPAEHQQLVPAKRVPQVALRGFVERSVEVDAADGDTECA